MKNESEGIEKKSHSTYLKDELEEEEESSSYVLATIAADILVNRYCLVKIFSSTSIIAIGSCSCFHCHLVIEMKRESQKGQRKEMVNNESGC